MGSVISMHSMLRHDGFGDGSVIVMGTIDRCGLAISGHGDIDSF